MWNWFRSFQVSVLQGMHQRRIVVPFESKSREKKSFANRKTQIITIACTRMKYFYLESSVVFLSMAFLLTWLNKNLCRSSQDGRLQNLVLIISLVKCNVVIALKWTFFRAGISDFKIVFGWSRWFLLWNFFRLLLMRWSLLKFHICTIFHGNNMWVRGFHIKYKRNIYFLWKSCFSIEFEYGLSQYIVSIKTR